jgi:hypothetical protein
MPWPQFPVAPPPAPSPDAVVVAVAITVTVAVAVVLPPSSLWHGSTDMPVVA